MSYYYDTTVIRLYRVAGSSPDIRLAIEGALHIRLELESTLSQAAILIYFAKVQTGKSGEMPVPILRIPTPLRSYTAGESEVVVQGRNVAEAIHDLVAQYPALQPHLFNSEGALRPFVNLFLGKVNVNDLQGLETPLGAEERLLLVPSIAGG
ncbi:MAG: MoaD/ThiS family protein [Anaerolineales bacterium]|nr:MoaD/ThiS family protein [Anaerolineales bacterium]